jgi:hypothetical protein
MRPGKATYKRQPGQLNDQSILEHSKRAYSEVGEFRTSVTNWFLTLWVGVHTHIDLSNLQMRMRIALVLLEGDE